MTEQQQKLGNRNGKKTKCIDISSDTLAKFHTGSSRHGRQRETLKEKLDLF